MWTRQQSVAVQRGNCVAETVSTERLATKGRATQRETRAWFVVLCCLISHSALYVT